MGASPQFTLRTFLVALGVLLLAAGIFWPFVSRYFGRLPGDIVVRRPGFTFVFPIVTCLVLSLLLTLLLSIFRR
jgi:Protein of unknown function (DUF2905)